MRRRRAESLPCIALALLAPAQAAQAKTFAWKASGKGGAIYLIGSIHVMSESFYPLNPALEAAFKDSDLLVEEVDLAEMLDPTAQLSILSRGMLPGEPVARQGALAGDDGARQESGRRSRRGRRTADALQAVDARDRAAGHGAGEGRLRSGARPRSSISTIRRKRAARACRGSRRWNIRSRASTA